MSGMPNWAKDVVSAAAAPVERGEVDKLSAFVQVEQRIKDDYVRSRFAVVQAYNCGRCEETHVEFSYTHDPAVMVLARRADGSIIYDGEPESGPGI